MPPQGQPFAEPREQAVDREALGDAGGHGGKRPHRVLGGSVWEDQPRRDDSRSRVGFARGQEVRERVVPHGHVRVGQSKPRRRAPFGDQVDRGAVAEVLGRSDQLDPGVVRAHQLRRAVRGGIVDHPHAGGTNVRRRLQ